MQEISPKEYELPFFKEKGFVRKKCSSCGEYFWTLNPEYERCQDAPCVEYYFDKITSREPLSVRGSRERFLKFFEKHGHRIIEPRPVVARWREDLYLTIASIVDFQPHVTNGIVPPPANPLVISQPCIRLEDIDNVGLTMGRHLTLFEMGGHHAFNERDGKRIYWKNETLEYAFEFFVKEIGIPPEKIVFKESWWTGGGNAGPSFEVTVAGLELATLVFMQYKTVNNHLEPIPLQIVDTGYGIERIAWFTQKTPTAFHAIYGDLIRDFREKLGIQEPPQEFYRVAFKQAGLLDPEKIESINNFVNNISRSMNTSVQEAKRILEQEVKLYTLLDHTKTLTYMLADGIVPSNQGEGYLSRLVARRALKTLYLVNPELNLVELVEKQINLWSQDYPRIKENTSYILTIIELEEKKFRQLLKEKMNKALSIVLKSPGLDTLEKIYREMGIPPDLLAVEAGKKGKKIEVPHNFYAQLAKTGSESGTLGKKIEKETRMEWTEGLGETRLVFHDDPYATSLQARVIAVKDNMIVLDQTIIYPTGGGQVTDTGWIVKGDKKYRVKKAEKTGNVVIHYLDTRDHDIKPNDNVQVLLDWERRYRNMRHHTATHILIGSLRKILGNHVWQAGAEKTPDKARLDITHYEVPDRETINKIEDLANKIILQRIPVKTMFMDRNKAEEKYGFILYQGGVPPTRKLRIVEIPGHDVEACFGTHVSNTSEVGSIKITSVTKLQDGIIRLEYVSGTQTTVYARELEDILDSISEKVNAPRKHLAKRIENLLEEREELKTLLSRYRNEYYKQLRENLLSNTRKIGDYRIIVFTDKIGDDKSMMELLKKLVEENKDIIIARIKHTQNQSLVEISMGETAARNKPAHTIVKELAKKLNGKGGGKPDHAFLRLQQRITEDEVWEKLQTLLQQ